MYFRTVLLLMASRLFVVVSSGHQHSNALRILAIENIPGKSHWNFMSEVLRSLTDNGHSVTVFTPFPEGNRANYTEVDISGDVPIKVAMNAVETIPMFGKLTIILPLIMNMTRDFCRIIYNKSPMKDILNDPESHSNYDVVIAEVTSSECASYVAAMLRLPLIYVIPSPMITYMEYEVFGNVANPAAVSHLMAHHAVPSTFMKRLANVALLVYSMFITKRTEKQLRKIDPQPYDLVDPLKPSVVFMNTHFISEPPRPTLPSVVQVGGIHLKTPKNIPHEILEFIEASPHGVIYFTFGSVVSMSTLPDHIQNTFKEVLGQLPQRVLWKYEGVMKDKPNNVMTSKWFPQRDVLLHPKVKLFISHGGISGVYEAVDAGVPVLGFPLFYDQPRNIENLVDAGMAISMDLLTVEKESLLKNVVELINNDRYIQNAKSTSVIFKDRPISPVQSVVYWTEYVVRHKGAPHLKSHALNLAWYQYFLLDVIAVLLTIIFLGLFVAYKIVKIILYRLYLKNLHNSKSKSE